MATTEMNYIEGGGSDGVIHYQYNIVTGSSNLEVNISGTPKAIYLYEIQRGYVYTNINPSTQEVDDTVMWYSSTGNSAVDTSISGKMFIRENGKIKANTSFGSYPHLLYYTTE